MGTLWRSESMQLIQLFVQIEACRDTVDELGQLGLIQFRDLNPETNAFQRNFVNEVKRYDEMERKLRFFNEQLVKADIKADLSFNYDESFIEPDSEVSGKVVIDELETKFEELEKEIIQINANQETLDRNYNELIEMQYVLDKDVFFFDEADIQRAEEGSGPIFQDEKTSLNSKQPISLQTRQTISLGFVTGVIERDKLATFERVLWRATRGNLFMKQSEIDRKIKDPHTGEEVEKNVFVIFFQGERAQAKIKKICESFGANLYPCPETKNARTEMNSQVSSRIIDLRTVLNRTRDHSQKVLTHVAINIDKWRALILKEKSIYHTMNLFLYDVSRRCLIAEGWCPTSSTEAIQKALRTATERSGALVPSVLSIVRSSDTPPTYFKTNKYTEAFQNIVDAYGIAKYQEVNPGVFTIITFPFLFAVMFGDFGHGIILTISAALFVYYEKKLGEIKLNEMVQTCYDGRYVLLLMGIFSMYVGLIYNEAFAIPFNLFGTNWILPHVEHGYAHWDWNGTAYLFGVDPEWKNANNDLLYYNSLKMKLSIILGVTQMVLGIILSAFNAVHFKKTYSLLLEFIPQMVFMLGIFGYMCILIIYKWCTDWEHNPPQTLCAETNGQFHCEGPPSILNLMIAMFLNPVGVPQKFHIYEGQGTVQILLLLASLISVPIMLLGKPYYLKYKHGQTSQKAAGYSSMEDEPTEHGGHGGGHGEHGEHFDFSEEMVHQSIHTIEFVLGAISNTASYLRLWALSLAHAELSVVFWEMVLHASLHLTDLGGAQVIALFIAFAIWAALTVGVLLLMESLSAFLHALRLHWVEFQNKFYAGDGHKFSPFSYIVILKGEN